MNCPVCQTAMIKEDFGGVKVNVCENGCKGIWFDWGELKKLDEKNEGCGNALKEALTSPRVNGNNRGSINCPKCGMPMHKHAYESDNEVTIDECYSCGGFFLDSGELEEIRNNHMSEQQEEQYANKLLKNIPTYQEEKRNLEKDENRAEAIRHYTRFMRIKIGRGF